MCGMLAKLKSKNILPTYLELKLIRFLTFF
jgi:hypothetical protein